MSESYHTSRMRETCTSGSQEGRGSDGHWPSAFQSVLLAYSTVLLFNCMDPAQISANGGSGNYFAASILTTSSVPSISSGLL